MHDPNKIRDMTVVSSATAGELATSEQVAASNIQEASLSFVRLKTTVCRFVRLMTTHGRLVRLMTTHCSVARPAMRRFGATILARHCDAEYVAPGA
jgi:hypothetical protein